MRYIKFTPMRWLALLLGIVCILSLALPPEPQTLKDFHLSLAAYRVVIIFLLIPEALLWYASFYAYAKLHEYTCYIKDSREYQAFQKITLGMGVLAYGLIVPSIISPVLNYIAARNSSFHATSMIINHYLNLVVSLLALSILRGGSQKLVGSGASIKRGSLLGMRLLALFFITLAVVYSYTTLHTRRVNDNPYYMGLIPLMVTIIIPYLYAWFEGLISAYNFRLYSKNVRGLLYKKAFFQLAVGLLLTVIGFIFVQFITSTLGARTDKSIGFVLVLIYILLAVLIAGLGLMALGTRKLKKIEEV
jgi:hypothetical protein